MKYNPTEEADRVFRMRGWQKIRDATRPLPIAEVVRRSKKKTSLFDLLIEEIEYKER